MPPRRRCPTGPRTMRSCCREVRTVSNLVEDLASRVLHLHVSLADAKSRLMASGAMGRRRGGCARGVGGLRGRKGELMRCHVTLSGGTSKPEASSSAQKRRATAVDVWPLQSVLYTFRPDGRSRRVREWVLSHARRVGSLWRSRRCGTQTRLAPTTPAPAVAFLLAKSKQCPCFAAM